MRSVSESESESAYAEITRSTVIPAASNAAASSSTRTAIMRAMSSEHVAHVRFFLDRGADIRTPRNRSGETTLEFAERVGNAEIVAMLRERLGG